jgi:WD40 repeat protein
VLPSSVPRDDDTWDADRAEAEAERLRAEGGAPPDAPAPTQSIPFETSGRYQASEKNPDLVAEEIGRGGIGRVIAIHDTVLGRQVARKEVLGRASAAAVARFLQEARITAQLDHPNVVPVYELARSREGTLYYTMKRVRGRTLADALKAAGTLAGRLALLDHFVDLCQAIAYAHSRGVIHRDIKPQNVMIGEFGETIVLDWGLAKVRGQEDIRGGEIARGIDKIADMSSFGTMQGTTLGTPAYMAPEQAMGAIDAIDERSDLWSLGAVLFELLAGEPPFVAASPQAVLRDLREGVPVLVDERAHDAPPELRAIVSKALMRDPGDRYATAKQLADDVRAYQSGGRVGAYHYSGVETVRRALLPYRAALAVAAAALGILAIAGTVSHVRMSADRDRALEAEQLATARSAALDEMLQGTLADASITALDGDRAGEALLFAASSLGTGENPRARGAVVAATSRVIPALGWSSGKAGCKGVAFAPDGAHVACAGSRGVHVWALRDGAVVGAPVDFAAPEGATGAIAWSPGGERVAVGGAGGAELREAATGTLVTRFPVLGVAAIAFLPDGTVITGEEAHGPVAIRAWDPAGKLLRSFPGHEAAITALAMSRDGRLASGGADHTTRVWDAATGKPLATLPSPEGALALAWTPDGHLAAGGDRAGGDGTVRVFDANGVAGRIRGHRGEVLALATSADGRFLASGATDGVARVWDSHDERLVAAATIPSGGVAGARAVRGVALSPDGGLLAAADGAGELRLWALPANPRADRLLGSARAVTDVAFATDGAVVSISEDGTVRTWDAGGHVVGAVAVNPLGVRALALAGGTALVGDAQGAVHRVDLATGLEGTTLPLMEGAVWTIAVSPDGQSFAAGGEDDHVHFGSVRGDAERAIARPLEPETTGIAYQADGTSVWTVGRRLGWLQQFGATDGNSDGKAQGDAEGLVAVAASPDGKLLATGGPVVRVWTTPGPRLSRELDRDGVGIDALAFSPDGALLAAAAADRTVRLWDVSTWTLLAVIPGHDGRITGVAWSADGSTLASSGTDRVVRLWDVSELRTPASELLAAARHGTGEWIDPAGQLAADPDWKP